jgi:hypothetical protein
MGKKSEVNAKAQRRKESGNELSRSGSRDIAKSFLLFFAQLFNGMHHLCAFASLR